MKKGILLVLIQCLVQVCCAQKEGNIWYFGKNVGLDFNTSPPTAITGALNTLEGCSSIANPLTGEILLYTDGTTVWDRNHNVMPGNVGNPLMGHTSSSQSAVIIPQPGSATRYYIFTTAAQASGVPPSLCYSVVDLSLNGGNGDLVSLNNVLLDTTTEKLTAVGSCDRSVYWVLGHKWNCDSFYAFRLTNAGLSAPVKSKTGSVHSDPTNTVHGEAAGYMKFAPDGKKLGLVVSETNIVELFDFDFSTGLLSNPITDPITFPTQHFANDVYGCSFSPDGSKFYVSAYFFPMSRKVFQYDMNAGDATAILASKTDVAVQSDTARIVAALQNGPDGKMYGITVMGNSLDVIHNPNAAGAACNYQPNGVYLSSFGGRLGLPCIVESFLAPPPTPLFLVPVQRALCKGDTIEAPQPVHNTFSILPGTGVSVSGDSAMVTFSPGTTTTYTVINTSPCNKNDTTTFTIYVSLGPVAAFTFNPADLAPDDDFITLDNLSTGAQSYNWYDGDGVLRSSAVNYKLPHPGLGLFCYTLQAKDTVGCVDTVSHCIDIKQYGAVFIPNSFSPNNDGVNDVFRVFGLFRQLEEFSVYNRYGERIYSSTNKNQGWDGRYQAQPCDEGTYYYRIRYLDGKGVRITKKGDVILIR